MSFFTLSGGGANFVSAKKISFFVGKQCFWNFSFQKTNICTYEEKKLNFSSYVRQGQEGGGLKALADMSAKKMICLFGRIPLLSNASLYVLSCVHWSGKPYFATRLITILCIWGRHAFVPGSVWRSVHWAPPLSLCLGSKNSNLLGEDSHKKVFFLLFGPLKGPSQIIQPPLLWNIE